MKAKLETKSTNKVERISIDKLFFDEENPRLVQIDDFKDLTEDEKVAVLWRDMEAQEIADSIAANGYFFHEQLFAEKVNNSKYIVIEGNRRLAAVKVLLSKTLQNKLKVEDLSKLTPTIRNQIKQLPVVVTTRKDIWHYVGFKHVNGPRPWDAYSKAEYIARVHNEFDVPLKDISRQIGDRHSTVRRLYRGLMALDQAERNHVFDRHDRITKRFFFSHLYTGLGSAGIQAFLSLKEETSYKPRPITRTNISKLGELCVWIYGSKSKGIQPLIKSQNPDLNDLAEALQTKRGADALRAGLPLQVAVDASKGDERIFREALIAAKHSLQTAAGTVTTGYDGKSDTRQTAEQINYLSDKLIEDMEDLARKRRKTKRGRTSK